MTQPTEESDYWYEHQNELLEGQVFQSRYGLVKLDRRVPCDGTQWYVAVWSEGYPGTERYQGVPPGWRYDDTKIEPGDLTGEPLPDPKEKR